MRPSSWPNSGLSRSRALAIKRSQKFVRDRSPPVRIESQQMAVARNTVEKLEVRAAAGCDECLIEFADQGFLVKLVVVCIQPQLRDLVGRAATSIRIVRCGNRSVGKPAAGEIHHSHDLTGLEAGIVHREKPAA